MPPDLGERHLDLRCTVDIARREQRRPGFLEHLEPALVVERL